MRTVPRVSHNPRREIITYLTSSRFDDSAEATDEWKNQQENKRKRKKEKKATLVNRGEKKQDGKGERKKQHIPARISG